MNENIENKIQIPRRPRLTGEKSFNWKGGKATCVNCQKLLSNYKGEKCRNCSVPKREKAKCLDCNKQLLAYYTERCRSCNNKGARGSNWKGGIAPVNQAIRNSLEYEEWRTKVFERDNYTCQECGQIGNYLNADHIKPFSIYIDLRFELSNGRTLCVPCHKKTDTYGVKAWRQTQV